VVLGEIGERFPPAGCLDGREETAHVVRDFIGGGGVDPENSFGVGPYQPSGCFENLL
jgi:hypothetical protein